ncbi:MAG TPA: ABC transporter permease [Gemmatimonadaceae bacterium]
MTRFFRRRVRDGELDAEIRAHLEMAVRDRVARGEAPSDAELAARREFGNVALVKEVTRDMWGGGGASLERVANDFRYAVRTLSRAPGFAAVAVLTLALGIGANTAIFSVVNGVILRPLAYPHPEQLVLITSQFPGLGFDQFPVDAAEFLEFRERNRSFSNVGAYVTSAVNIGTRGRPVRVASAIVSASLFPTLGVAPEVGRTLTEEETLPNAAPVAVLSDELWRSTFGGERSIIGQKADIDGVQTQIVGVMPAGFDVHDQQVKIWQPLTLDPAQRQQYRGSHFLQLVGRMKDGVTMLAARTELQTLLTQWPRSDGGSPTATPGQSNFVHTPNTTTHRLRYDDLRTDIVGSAGRALWVLQAAVFFVLLIACANLANLLLMRAETRHKELVLRAALGAGRGRLMRQFLAESLVLSVAGGVLGLVVARWGLRALVLTNGAGIPRATRVTLDGRVLAFTLALALGTGLVFGLAPLLRLTTDSMSLTLRDAGSRTTARASGSRLRRALVVGEMALAVMLVVGAGLLLRSFDKLTHVDSGFDRARLTTFNVVLPAATYADSTRRVAFFDEVTRQLAMVPGVESAAAMTGLPPLRQVNANDTRFEGFVPRPGGPAQNVDYYQWVTPNYLSTMRIPVVAGRAFNGVDGPASPPVVMVNQTLARLFFPGQTAIGHRLQPGGTTDTTQWFTIVGVVKDVKQGGVDAKTGTELYLLDSQAPTYEGFAPRNMNIVLRSPLAPAVLASNIHRIVSALDPTLPVVGLRSMDDVFAVALARPRFLAELLAVFAGVALALAAIGTYGVLAYSVAERRREIGIRMALGASERGVLALILRQGMVLAAIGLAVGLGGALAVTRLVSSLLFDVQPTDPATYGAVGAFMLVVALVACLVPARRATRVDPLVALRMD